MKKEKVFFLLIILLLCFPSFSKADFSNITDPVEGKYFFSGQANNGSRFVFTVEFDLWKDLDAGLYQYRYRLYNNNDDSDSRVRSLIMGHRGSIVSYDLGTGRYAPNWFRYNDTRLAFIWSIRNSVPENQITPWFCFTSYGKPEIYSAGGLGVAPRARASGHLPAPAPEPYSFILLVIGFLGVGVLFRYSGIPAHIK